MTKITGNKEFAARLGRIAGPGKAGPIGKALYAAGNLIEIDAEISITKGSVSGKKHVASLPGQAPNRDSGTLDNNIETVLVSPLKVEVSSNAPYAAALEFGTSKMAARPYMRPAVARKKAEAVAMIQAAVAKVVNGNR